MAKWNVVKRAWVEWHKQPGTAAWGARIPSGRTGILALHPVSLLEPTLMTRTVRLDAAKPELKLGVAATAITEADWVLTIKVDGESIVQNKVISMADGWLDLSYDLSKFANKTVTIEIIMAGGGQRVWFFEQSFIDYITIAPMDA